MRLRVKHGMTKAVIKRQNAIMTEPAQNVVGAGSRPRKNVNIALVCVGRTGMVGCTGGKTPLLRRDRKSQKLYGRTVCSSTRTRNARPYDRRFCLFLPSPDFWFKGNSRAWDMARSARGRLIHADAGQNSLPPPLRRSPSLASDGGLGN